MSTSPNRTRNLILSTHEQARRLAYTNDLVDIKLILLEHLELEIEELQHQYEEETGHALDTGELPQQAQQETQSLAISEGSGHS